MPNNIFNIFICFFFNFLRKIFFLKLYIYQRVRVYGLLIREVKLKRDRHVNDFRIGVVITICVALSDF